MLEGLGELARAAEAYGRAEDVEGQARVLARGGEVERLDDLLEAEQARDREARATPPSARGVRSARRERPEARGRRSRAQSSAGGALRARGLAMIARRVTADASSRRDAGPRDGDRPRRANRRRTRARRPGTRSRAVGVVAVASAAVSRRHLSIVAPRGRGLGARSREPQRNDAPTDERSTVRRRHGRGPRSPSWGARCRSSCIRPTICRARSPSRSRARATWRPSGRPARHRPLAPGVRSSGGVEDWLELVTDDAPPAFAGGLRLCLARDATRRGCVRDAVGRRRRDPLRRVIVR